MQENDTAISRRIFVSSVTAASVGMIAAPYVLASNKSGYEPILLGQDGHTYEMTHDWLKPPKGMAFGDTHGLTQDKQGRIYLAHTVHGSSESKNAVAVYDENGKFINSWGSEFAGGAHGLDIRDESGEEFIYHCDTRRSLVVKTNLEGEKIWEMELPKESGDYPEGKRWVPTNVAFAPNGDFYVGDGYGSSYIHQYTEDCEMVRKIAGPGSGEGEVRCPHGLWVDDRDGTPKLAVADRSNNRIQYFSLKGDHLGFVKDGMRMPCHFKTRGEYMLVPDLHAIVTILDKDNKVVAHLGDGLANMGGKRGVTRDKYIEGEFIHPHDAIFLANGDILVAEWVPIGRVTLLKKVDV